MPCTFMPWVLGGLFSNRENQHINREERKVRQGMDRVSFAPFGPFAVKTPF
jgi:hypothetical protein